MEEMNEKKRAAAKAAKQAESDMQELLDSIQKAQLAREKAEADAAIEQEKAQAEIKKAEQDAYAATVERIMKSVSPDLIAALSTKANADLMIEATKSMSPYAIANGESVSDTVNKLMRGTSLEGLLNKMAPTEEESLVNTK